jgi:RNA polymerase sigma-70 factor (ECF subfamily)
MSAVVEESRFEELARHHRRELHVHCYRMLASYDDADDAVQETYLRAWRGWADVAHTALRAWLYRIATNVCLDLIRARSRRVGRLTSFAEVPWLQPYPDRVLDELTGDEDGPETVAVARETIELAFIAAVQVLPPRQRAALILRDVLGMPATETASMLETSVAAANSALQRARATMQEHLPTHRLEWSASQLSAQERQLLDRFIDAHERGDAHAAMEISLEDLRVTMPPAPYLFDGRDAIAPLLERAFGPDRDGDWKLLPTSANRMPAAGSYLRRTGDTEYRAFKLDVLRIEEGGVAEITTFGYSMFPALGLPMVLDRDSSATVRTEPSRPAPSQTQHFPLSRSPGIRDGEGGRPTWDSRPPVCRVAQSSPPSSLLDAVIWTWRRNSTLLRVFFSRSRSSSIPCWESSAASTRRSFHMIFSSSAPRRISSRRVLEALTSTAGKIRRLASSRERRSSMLPVPLNSSKITSSIREPVSTSAVARMVSEPPFSMFRAAPKNFFGG